MEISYLDYKDNYYHLLNHKKKCVFLTGNKRPLTMTDVKDGPFNQYLHVQILLVCVIMNDTLINV